MRDSERYVVMSDEHRAVTTLALFGYLVTVLAWELELGVVLLHVFAKKKLDPFAHAALLGVSITLTAFTYVQGSRDFLRLRRTRGRVRLTGLQVVLITMFIVTLGTTLGLITMRLVNH
jgi:uncharacterized membrane protein